MQFQCQSKHFRSSTSSKWKWVYFLHLIAWIRGRCRCSFLCGQCSVATEQPLKPVFLLFLRRLSFVQCACLLSSIAAGLNDPNVITLSTAITKDNFGYLCVFQLCAFMLTICSQCRNAIHQNVRKWSDAQHRCMRCMFEWLFGSGLICYGLIQSKCTLAKPNQQSAGLGKQHRALWYVTQDGGWI